MISKYNDKNLSFSVYENLEYEYILRNTNDNVVIQIWLTKFFKTSKQVQNFLYKNFGRHTCRLLVKYVKFAWFECSDLLKIMRNDVQKNTAGLKIWSLRNFDGASECKLYEWHEIELTQSNHLSKFIRVINRL